MAETIKRTAFKITRMGELVGREAARRLGTVFGIVDVSLAPTPAVGDSVADILELIGVERTGAPGTTAALALLTDAVKKGGAMASSSSAACRAPSSPCPRTPGMVDAVAGRRALAREARGDDDGLLGGPRHDRRARRDSPVETLACLIADELAIGMVNQKTTAVRAIPVPGKGPGETHDWGGLLGTAIVQDPGAFGCETLWRRGGRIPAPLQSYRN